MTKKIYISPSDQTENRYAWGNTNEHAQCQRIAEAEAAALRRSGVEVKLADKLKALELMGKNLGLFERGARKEDTGEVKIVDDIPE